MATREIPINNIEYGENIRIERDDDIKELAGSIEKYDVLSPLVVRPIGNGRYEVICGHRRYKALKEVGGNISVPCIVRDDIEGEDILKVQLEENIQRKQMSAAELVKVFDQMKKQSGGKLINKDIAKMLNKNVQWVESQYFAMSKAKELYGENAVEVVEKTNATAGKIIGQYQKKKRESNKIKLHGFTVEHLGKIITIKVDDIETLNRIVAELMKM